MRRKLYPINVRSRLSRITSAWDQICLDGMIGNITRAGITAEMAQADTIEAQIRTAEIQLAALRNQRDAVYLSLWDKLKRVYAGVKANYGDDSIQYEMVGRTPLSKKKHRSRQVTVEKVIG